MAQRRTALVGVCSDQRRMYPTTQPNDAFSLLSAERVIRESGDLWRRSAMIALALSENWDQ